MMLNVKNNVDKANGYCFGPEERNVQAYMSSAYGVTDFEYSKTSEVREQYMDNDLDKIDKEPGFQVWFLWRIKSLYILHFKNLRKFLPSYYTICPVSKLHKKVRENSNNH